MPVRTKKQYPNNAQRKKEKKSRAYRDKNIRVFIVSTLWADAKK